MIMNLKLEFWGYNEKKYGLSFDTTKYYFRLSLGDENAMGTYHFKIAKFEFKETEYHGLSEKAPGCDITLNRLG